MGAAKGEETRADAVDSLAIAREVDSEYELVLTMEECACDCAVQSFPADFLLHTAAVAGALQNPAVLSPLAFKRVNGFERKPPIDAQREGASASGHSCVTRVGVVPVSAEEWLGHVGTTGVVVDVHVEGTHAPTAATASHGEVLAWMEAILRLGLVGQLSREIGQPRVLPYHQIQSID